MNDIELKDTDAHHFEAIIDLYASVGWSNYGKFGRENIVKMLEQSTYRIGAFQGDSLVGFVRGLSDGVAIHFIQDILVHPNYQRKGIGNKLMTSALNLYLTVHKTVLLTDDEHKQIAFYESMGFTNTKEVRPPMNVFMKCVAIV